MTETVRHKRPVVHTAGTILRMGTITISYPVDADVITRPELINITGHTKLQPLPGVAQPAAITLNNLNITRYIAIPCIKRRLVFH